MFASCGRRAKLLIDTLRRYQIICKYLVKFTSNKCILGSSVTLQTMPSSTHIPALTRLL